jgi:hypothetical protein
VADPREPIEAWIDEALVADVMWMRSARAIVFVSPSRDQVRAMIEAVAPLIAAASEAKLAALREYRTLVDEDGEQVILIGPCAETIGCLFSRNYDSPTLGTLIDAAAEHEGGQGEQAHAHVAEMAAEWDAYAAKRNAELARKGAVQERSDEKGPQA